MVNIIDYKEELSKLFRDVLRGVDSTNTSNGYITEVHHPNDYESDRKTLKASNLWVDPRSWIIVGQKQNADNDVVIGIEPVDVGDLKLDAQGSEEYDLENGTWHVKIDMSASKPYGRYWRDKVSQQVLKAFVDNKDSLFQNYDFVKWTFTINNTTADQVYQDVVQINLDMCLKNI